MADTLLRSLSNADLDWMITRGERKQIPANQSLLSPQDTQDLLYVLIEGRLGLFVDSVNTSSADSSTYALLDELRQGEIVELSALFNRSETTIVRTLDPSMVMSLPLKMVQAKLTDDLAFASHFYRAIAIMLSNHLRRIFERPGNVQSWGDRSAKEVLSVFGELRDSDVDWLVSFGQTEAIATDRVLLQAGRPVDALYILLDGQMAISAPDGHFNPLYLCFSGLENSTRNQKILNTLSKGSMPGIISFIDSQPLPVTIRATQESFVYAVPRQKLITKLQVDDSFASRFYRVIAIEILEMLQTIRSRLSDSAFANLDMGNEELDMEDLQQMSEGAKKFNWMLSQLGVAPRG